jgi:hypothetical protein
MIFIILVAVLIIVVLALAIYLLWFAPTHTETTDDNTSLSIDVEHQRTLLIQTLEGNELGAEITYRKLLSSLRTLSPNIEERCRILRSYYQQLRLIQCPNDICTLSPSENEWREKAVQSLDQWEKTNFPHNNLWQHYHHYLLDQARSYAQRDYSHSLLCSDRARNLTEQLP